MTAPVPLALPAWVAMAKAAHDEIGPDVSLAEASMLLLVHAHPGYSVRHYAFALGWHRPRVTRALDELARLALLVRHPEPDDRRQIRAVLTEAGVKAARQMIQVGWVAEAAVPNSLHRGKAA